MPPYENTQAVASHTLEECSVYPYPYVRPDDSRRTRSYRFLKRVTDIIFSSLALVFLSPFLLLVALLIRLDSPGPAIYTQTRIGKRQKPFTMYKFRSMCVDAEARQRDLEALNERDGPVFKIARDPRITRVGAFIRKTCIDELPQLLNILKGDMSLVGPRPPLPQEVEQYVGYQYRRLDVTPGLTCYWQISDRNMSFNQWVALDLQYIRDAGFWRDMSILLRTVAVVFRTKGDA